MNDKLNYKPHLPQDKKYIEDIAGKIKEKACDEDIKFKYLIDTLKLLGFNENPYSLINLQNLNPDSIQQLVEKSFEKINNVEVSDEIKQSIWRLWDYLAEEDSLEKADLIFVFGGPGIQRANKAIDLYLDKYANKILFSGKEASYMKSLNNKTEAEYYAEIAKDKGVNVKDIIIEKQAKNTPENAVNSVEILKEMDFLPKKIIAMTLPYHMRRSYLTLKSVIDWEAKIIRRTVPSAKYTRENYFRDKNGWSYIFFEYIKMYGARLMKHF